MDTYIVIITAEGRYAMTEFEALELFQNASKEIRDQVLQFLRQQAQVDESPEKPHDITQ